MKKILIVDDHSIVRVGLKQIISGIPDMVVAGEASTVPAALNEALNKDFDLVLLDISLGKGNGLDILKEVKNKKPSLPILVLSFHPAEQYAVRTLKAGAAGYLTKESAPEELITAIQKVLSGGKYISSSAAEQLICELKSDIDKPPHQTLSNCEYQVMCMIASGNTIKEIANQMVLSIKTIYTYRSRILRKMHMKNNIELTHYVIANKLIE